jgi:hypothetical protein
MGLVEYIILVVVVGSIVWAVWSFTPIPAQFKKLILWVAIIVLVLVLLHAMGIIGKDVAIPKVH